MCPPNKDEELVSEIIALSFKKHYSDFLEPCTMVVHLKECNPQTRILGAKCCA